MSKVKALYNIVFATKNRCNTIPLSHKNELYAHIWELVKDEDCKLLRIGGIADHVHMLIDLNPSVSLSDLVRKIKSESSGWAKRSEHFSKFNGWGKEYFATTVSNEESYAVVEYIKSQEYHHYGTTFEQEAKRMAQRMGCDWHDDDLM